MCILSVVELKQTSPKPQMLPIEQIADTNDYLLVCKSTL